MLPEMDGLTICRKVREFSQIPIIMVTAKESVEDRVHGLDIGADDYITKPFAVQELLARIRAVFRKQTALNQIHGQKELRLNKLVLYPDRFEAQADGKPIELTKKEYELLLYLVSNKQIVLSRERILHEIWGYDFIGDTNIVDVFIHYLRDKLNESLGENIIYTVRGVGYVVKD
jgi:DNA-binding response OmpR family regulator